MNLKGKYLVVAADDMGKSSSVNLAIAEAHDSGIVTAASIMPGGRAFDEAVQIARNRKRLSIGLHVTLCDGRAVLKPSRIPDLVDSGGNFEESPVRAWLGFMGRGVLSQIEAEVDAQFSLLDEAGIHPTHVDSHHHLHMNPLVFEVICRQASKRGVGWIRLPNEPLSVVLHSGFSSRGIMPFSEWAVFGILRARNLKIARKYGLNVACNVFGLSQTDSIDEKYIFYILDRFCGSINEFFVHPDISSASGRKELYALRSPGIRSRIAHLGIDLIGYKGLPGDDGVFDSVLETT